MSKEHIKILSSHNAPKLRYGPLTLNIKSVLQVIKSVKSDSIDNLN